MKNHRIIVVGLLFAFAACDRPANPRPADAPPKDPLPQDVVAKASPERKEEKPAGTVSKEKEKPKPAEVKIAKEKTLDDYLAAMGAENDLKTAGAALFYRRQYAEARKRFEKACAGGPFDSEAEMWVVRCLGIEADKKREEGKESEAAQLQAESRQRREVLEMSSAIARHWLEEWQMFPPARLLETDALIWLALNTTDSDAREFALAKLETLDAAQAERLITALWNPHLLKQLEKSGQKQAICAAWLISIAKSHPKVKSASYGRALDKQREFNNLVNFLGVSSGDLSGTIARTSLQRQYWNKLINLLRENP